MNFNELCLQSAFEVALIELREMIISDIQSCKISPFEEGFFYWVEDAPQQTTATYKPSKKKGTVRNLIDSKLKITTVARHYGLEVVGNMTKCLFPHKHKAGDRTPSLSLSDEKNCFHCFGCGWSGDIVEFIRVLEERK